MQSADSSWFLRNSSCICKVPQPSACLRLKGRRVELVMIMRCHVSSHGARAAVEFYPLERERSILSTDYYQTQSDLMGLLGLLPLDRCLCRLMRSFWADLSRARTGNQGCCCYWSVGCCEGERSQLGENFFPTHPRSLVQFLLSFSSSFLRERVLEGAIVHYREGKNERKLVVKRYGFVLWRLEMIMLSGREVGVLPCCWRFTRLL